MTGLPRISISACQGRSGKTVVSMGLCAALAQQGLIVQPFKKGPDYVDPSLLTAAAGRPCRNLDAFLMSEGTILNSFQQGCRGVDLALMEGVMGLYDSFVIDGKGSTAWIARLLGMPIILLINASRMTRSVAAVIKGFQSFEPDTWIAGVILNNVSLSIHRRRLIEAIERYCDIPVLGTIPNDGSFNISEANQGLIPYRAVEDAKSKVEHLRDNIKPHLDLEGILSIARKSKTQRTPVVSGPQKEKTSVQIGVIFDRVFNFYYPENLEALQQAGADLVFIDSLQDRRLPDIDGLYIGGGPNELFADKLEDNAELRKEIAQAIEDGLPVYAECGGLQYLCRGIHLNGRRYEMVGAIPCEVEMCRRDMDMGKRPQGHGYRVVEVVKENPWFPIGSIFRGHQFHYSRLFNADELEFAYRIKRGREGDSKVDGIVYKNVFAAYTHLHALSTPQWVEAFVSLALKRRKRNRLVAPIKI